MAEDERRPAEEDPDLSRQVDEIFTGPGGQRLEAAGQLSDKLKRDRQRFGSTKEKFGGLIADPEASADEQLAVRSELKQLADSQTTTQNAIDWHLKAAARQQKIARIKSGIGRLFGRRQ